MVRTTTRFRRWSGLLLALVLGASASALPLVAPAEAATGEAYLNFTVQDVMGDPLGGASVQLYVANQTPQPDAPEITAASGVDGVAHVVIPGPFPKTFVVHVDKPGYVGQWKGASDYQNAWVYFAHDGETTDQELALVQKLRMLDVNVYDPDSGADLSGATVGLYSSSGSGSSPDASAVTSATGKAKFRIATADTGGLPEGLYRLRAERAGYLTQWYTVDLNDFAHATDIDLTGEEGMTSVDIAMTAGTPVSFASAPKPTIDGTAKKGRRLTARAGAWSPKPSVLKYRWYRGSKAITGATAKTYVLKGKDVGKRISVRVTAARPGYVTTVRKSAKTAAVTP